MTILVPMRHAVVAALVCSARSSVHAQSVQRTVLAELKTLTNKPVRTLINSHWHMDHWMGNEVFAEAFPGLQIVATTITRDLMKRMPAAYFFDQSGIAREHARIDSARRAGAGAVSASLRELEAAFAKDSAFADQEARDGVVGR